MKKILIFAMATLVVSSCNFGKKKKKDFATSFAEKVIEKTTGEKIDAPNLNNVENNKVKLNLTLGGESLESNFKNSRGMVTAMEEGLIINVSSENDEENIHAIVITVNAKDITSLAHPIKSSVDGNENTDSKVTIMISKMGGNEFYGYMSTEGTVFIEKLNDDKALVHIDAKASMSGSPDESKWVDLKGTIEIDYPVFSSLGVKKSSVTY